MDVGIKLRGVIPNSQAHYTDPTSGLLETEQRKQGERGQSGGMPVILTFEIRMELPTGQLNTVALSLKTIMESQSRCVEDPRLLVAAQI